jgi:hypothetical protein
MAAMPPRIARSHFEALLFWEQLSSTGFAVQRLRGNAAPGRIQGSRPYRRNIVRTH